MQLGTVTHFNQGWSTSLLPYARSIGADLVRDGVTWNKIELETGVYDFSSASVTYPDFLEAAGMSQILVFGRPQAHVDGGHTPFTNEGRAAFADFVSTVLDRFPSIEVVEIGNEFNGQNFVTGPVKSGGYATKDDYYVALLEAVHERLAEDHPDVSILGGATHSVAVGYLRDTFELGALDYSDGIAVHPYTSTPEHVGDHLEILMRAMGDDPQPIYVTEFGGNFETPDEAPSYLVRMVSSLAASGVEAATWYALREQRWFPNMELMDGTGTLTPAGRSFAFMSDILGRGEAEDVSPDTLTHAVRFGSSAMAIWGAPRLVDMDEGARAFSAQGERILGQASISEDAPIIVMSQGGVTLDGNVHLDDSLLVGDTYLEFDVTNTADGTMSFDGPWAWYDLRGDGKLSEMEMREGQERSGVLWRPYLAGTFNPVRATEDSLLPADFGDGNSPIARHSVLERFTSPETMDFRIEAAWDVDDETTDGVDITIVVNGDEVWSGVVLDRYALDLPGLHVEKGQIVDIITGVNMDPSKDLTERRIQIWKEPPGTERDAIGEVGSVSVGDAKVEVRLSHSFENPVVIAAIAENAAEGPATVRAVNVESDRFDLILDEPDHLDGAQPAVPVSYLVVEAGRQEFADGTVFEAGLAETPSGEGPRQAEVRFAGDFDETPAILSTMQSMNGPEFVWTRTFAARKDGFRPSIVEQEAQMESSHTSETVGWLAVSRGNGQITGVGDDVRLQTSVNGFELSSTWTPDPFGEPFSGVPHVFGSLGSAGGNPVGIVIDGASRDGARFMAQEDQSLDTETWHTHVFADWLALEGDGLLFA